MDITLPTSFLNLADRIPKPLWNGVLILTAVLVGLILRWIFGLVFRIIFRRHENRTFVRAVVKRMTGPINCLFPLLITNLVVLPLMQLDQLSEYKVEKITEALIFVTIAFMLVRGVYLFEDYVCGKFELNAADSIRARKLRTQMQFIRRIIILVIFLITIALILISFQSLRKIGASLLAGVGISGIIIGFAAQKTLSNLLAGFQIAFTQPIRIDDIVVVENEQGRIEEITLTYVVVKIWDFRRLVLPITYFIEKPFYNWTRHSFELLGTVLIHLDYTVPIEALRQEFFRLLSTSPLWDQQTKSLAVTDSNDSTLQIRAVVSARNSSDLFDLRCFIREGLISFVQNRYPESLPRSRVEEFSRNIERT